MNRFRLLSLAACTALATPSFAATFTNNWSFVDAGTGQTVAGTISGLENGTNLSADGLTITVTQSPYAVFLGEFTVDFGAGAGFAPEKDSYSAAGGVITFADFLYTNEISEFLRFGSNPAGGTSYPDFVSYGTGEEAYSIDRGMVFSAVTASAPEPASWAMMVGGFGLLGAAMRRRRTSVSFA